MRYNLSHRTIDNKTDSFNILKFPFHHTQSPTNFLKTKKIHNIKYILKKIYIYIFRALVLPALLPALTKGAPAAPALPEFPSFKMMPELPSLTSLPLVPELLSKVQSVKQLLLMPKPPMMMMIHHPPPPPPPPVFLPEPMIDTGYHYAPPQMPFAKYGPP